MLPFLIAEGIPDISSKFVILFFISGILYFIGKYFAFKSFQVGEVSFISPLKGLLIVNVLITSFLILGEVPSIIGFIGIILIIIGTYILAIQKGHIRLLDPIKHLYTDKGSKLYLITILAYGFTVVFDKMGSLETTPLFWGFSMTLFLFCVTLPLLIKDFSNTKKIIIDNYKILSAIVVIHSGMTIGYLYIISNILASYTIAFRASSALFTVIIGGILFREKDLRKKFLASLIIVAGIFFIVLS